MTTADHSGVTVAPGLSTPGVPEAVVSASPDAIVGINAAGTIVMTNPAVETLFGYAPGDLLGQPVELLLPAALGATHVSHRQAYGTHPRTRAMGAGLRLSGRRRDGSEIPVDVGLAPVVTGESTLFVAFVRDATVKRRAESRLEATSEVTQAVLGGAAADVLWAMTARHARRIAGARFAGLITTPDEAGEVIIAAADGDGAGAAVGRTFPAEGTFADRVLGGRETVASTDLSSDARAGDIAHLLGVGPTVVVAIRGATRQFGTLFVARARHEAPFSAEDVSVLESYASSAAVAFTLGDARADLERLSMVEEGERIARDLHDTVIQRLFATGMSLAGVQRLTTSPATERIAQAVTELDDTIREIRSAIFALQQPVGSSGGLRREVQALAADAGRRLGYMPRVAFDGPLDTMVPTAVASDLLAVVREGLSNVLRHANATTVEVVIRLDGDDLIAVIGDDGVGLPDGRPPGSGLGNMVSRAERWGGRLTVAAAEPRGTRLEWRVPVR
jgi:PAS domain S-box-containing protein